MKRCVLLLFCSLFTLSLFAQEGLVPSTPEQLAALMCESSSLIGGVVSPMDGHLALREIDLVVRGAEPIVLSRVYVAPFIPCRFCYDAKYDEDANRKELLLHLLGHYRGWKFFPHLFLNFDSERSEVRLSEPSGAVLDFSIANSRTTLKTPLYAISNLGGEGPSGRCDPRNTNIIYKKDEIVVHASDGSERLYSFRWENRPSGRGYCLTKETLPNGRVVRYSYTKEHCLSRVESYDPQEKVLYASLDVSGSPWKGGCHFVADSGVTADYGYELEEVRIKIRKEKIRSTFPPALTWVSSPFYRHERWGHNGQLLLDFCSGKSPPFRVHYGAFGDPAHYRVKEILLPLSSTIYEMKYEPPLPGQKAGVTWAKRADGSGVAYHFSKELLPTLTQYFGSDGELKKEKLLTWDERHWLTSIEIREGSRLLSRRSYEYDPFGNPVVEALFGDLTGSGVDRSYAIRREFSQDGRHLLLKEEHENGKEITYSYLPNTNLVTKKEVRDRDRVLSTDRFVYDDAHNLIEAILDDGSRRRITRTILRQEAPFLHMPDWIEEFYLEGGLEKLLKKSHLIYDRYGNVAREEFYDANGQFTYAIEREYNERGDLLSESNPLGQRASYGYTDRGYCDSETNFSSRLETTRSYDLEGRLQEERVVGDDGGDHLTRWGYDFHDGPIEKIDPFGNQTSYTYDLLSNEVERSQFPSIVSMDGSPSSVVTRAVYDALGRKVEEVDANGQTTHYRYNLYGSIAEIVYPDSARESYCYEKDGRLAHHTDPEGLTISYTRDLLGRPLLKSYYSPKGELLAQESFTYDGSRLLSETDREGNTTRYFYDGAGRKIAEDRSGRFTQFSYDPLGRLSRVSRANGLTIDYERDLEGRVLEERRNDGLGRQLDRVSYTYDRDGHLATTTRWINGEESTYRWSYDAFGRLIEKEDPASSITQTTYDEHHLNPLGQRVVQVTTTDPLGVAAVETRDALDRVVKREVFTPQGTTLSSRELVYDPHGNLICEREFIYENGAPAGVQTLRYDYTSTNRLSRWIQGEGEGVNYTYTPSGKVKTKGLLSYSYDPLGFLSEVSGGGISQKFCDNKLGHLVYAEEGGVVVERGVDPFGNVIWEDISGLPAVEKRYDDANRLTSLRVDGIGEVTYYYDPLFLREVVRFSPDGKRLYCHRYEEYDESGHLLSEELIGSLGRVVHGTDLRGRKGSILSPYFAQECRYDSVGNVVELTTDGEKGCYGYDGLSQLISETGQSYRYDSIYNRTQKNGDRFGFNDQNQLLGLSYDVRGNQLTHGEFQLSYDALNRLVEAASDDRKITFSYDPLGRRLSKRVDEKGYFGWGEVEEEFYLYHDQDEIGAFSSDGWAKNFRVLGLNGATIGIELEGRSFAPLIDVQGNIRRLIDLETGVAHQYEFTAFGEELEAGLFENPWCFASKRFDRDLNLIHFGKRDYDPANGRWLTRDPAGFVDSINLYQYVFNNPFFYCDPDGQFAIAIPLITIIGGALTVPTLPVLLGGALAVGIAYQGYKLYDNYKVKQWVDRIWSGILQKNDTEKEEKEKREPVVIEGYAPDRRLPLDEHGRPIPESDTPHTQLGTRKSKKDYKYRQGREFGDNGKDIGRIDFTDHGDPTKHPCPHWHENLPNETGGTPKIGDAEPLPRWKY